MHWLRVIQSPVRLSHDESKCKEHDMLPACQLRGHGLVEATALRAEEHHGDLPALNGLQAAQDGLHRVEERLGLHHHAGPSPVRPVVNGPPAVVGERAQVVAAQVEQAALEGSLQDAPPGEITNHLREDGDYIDPHWRSIPSRRCTTIRLPGTSTSRTTSFVAGTSSSPAGPLTSKTSLLPVGKTLTSSPSSSPLSL